MTWYVYLLRCADDSLYAGITTDPARRVREHNSGKAGAKYTRSRRPVVLVWSDIARNRAEAGRREYAIKKMGREAKEALLQSPTGDGA
jgi:putative endonuclease